MAVEFKDYYRILGVDRTADDKTIKSAYRKLARKYHPDVAKGKDAGNRFREVAEAYEVLSDPEKRRRYDTLGPDWANMRPQGGGGQPGWSGGTVDFSSETWGASPTSSGRSSGTSAAHAEGVAPAPADA